AAADEHVVAVQLDERAELAHGVERRARVGRLQVALYAHGCRGHRANQRRAMGDRLVRGRAHLSAQRPGRREAHARRRAHAALVPAHADTTGNPSWAISWRARSASPSPTHSATTPWLLSGDGASAMSAMLTPARPSASAMSAITPGRLGTDARTSETASPSRP